MSSSRPRTSSIPDRKTALRIMLYVLLVLFMSNLGAMFDSVFHPEIPYFDEEHLVVGGITGITTVLLLGVLEMYLSRRKQVEAKLNESNERLRSAETKISKTLLMLESIVSTNPDVIFSVDLNVNLLMWNRSLEVVTGLATEALKNKPALELFVEEDRSAVLHSVQKCLEEGKGEVEARLFNAQGGSTLFHIKGVLLKGEEGNVIGITGTGRDITERKQAENSLRESERRYSDMLSNVELISMMLDRDGRVAFCNDYLLRLTGWRREEVLGSDWFELFITPGNDELKNTFAKLLDNLLVAFHNENEILTRSGERRLIHWSNTVLRSISGEVIGTASIGEDITDHKRAIAEQEKLQAQLQQAMKMEAVGRLAGGVAHDFNNLLTVIMGYSELLLQKIGKESPMHGEVEEIKRAGERAALLTQQLLAFSRKQIIEPKVLHLDYLVAEMHKMLARLIGENIALQATTGKSLGSVKADPGQFQQILVNLVVNARDAMPDGGKIVIETANVDLDEEYCALHPYVKPGRFVMLAVSDTGKGMSEEIKAHIFEPFFTTKEIGSGTGLGLATAYGAVKQSGGFIEVYSEVGIGTTVKIYLPRVEEEVVKPVKNDRPTDHPGGTETVLIVEDEGILRNLCVQILEQLGYRVLQARNGAEAISVAQKYGDRIDLLLTDVVMPGMNGSELATQLVLHHPEMKVLFTSGYTDDVITRHGVLDEGVSFISKPYTPSGLARKVREVLDGK